MELWENEVYRFKTIGQLKVIFCFSVKQTRLHLNCWIITDNMLYNNDSRPSVSIYPEEICVWDRPSTRWSCTSSWELITRYFLNRFQLNVLPRLERNKFPNSNFCRNHPEKQTGSNRESWVKSALILAVCQFWPPAPVTAGFCHADPRMARRTVQQHGHRPGRDGSPEERPQQQHPAHHTGWAVRHLNTNTFWPHGGVSLFVWVWVTRGLPGSTGTRMTSVTTEPWRSTWGFGTRTFTSWSTNTTCSPPSKTRLSFSWILTKRCSSDIRQICRLCRPHSSGLVLVQDHIVVVLFCFFYQKAVDMLLDNEDKISVGVIFSDQYFKNDVF